MANRRTIEQLRKLRDNVIIVFDNTRTWADNPQTSKSAPELRRRIRHLEEQFGLFASYNNDILTTEGNDTESDCAVTAVTAESKYFEIVSKLETLLEQATPEPSNEGSEYRSCSAADNSVRLPKLNLPKFSNKSEDWASFFQRFQSGVRSPRLDDLHRHEHLLSCLTGESADLVQNIHVEEGSYAVVIEILKRRYENKRLNLRLHLQKLFELGEVKENDPESLRKLANTALISIRAVENMGFKRDALSNELIVQLIVTKLDSRSRELWETSLNNEQAVDNAESDVDSYIFVTASKQNAPANTRQHPQRTRGAATALVTQSASSNPSSAQSMVGSGDSVVRMCPCCNQVHPLYHCDAFKRLPIQERYQRVRDAKLCVNCFRGGHWAKVCRSSKCKQCGKAHHTLLHPLESNNAHQPPPSSAAAPTPPSGTPSTTNQTSEPPKPTQSVSANATFLSAVTQRQLREVLLSTAGVRLTSATHHINATALLDGASHVTLLTKDIAQKLNLKLNKSSVVISGVGGALSSANSTTTIQLTSRNGEFSVNLHAIVVDSITDPLPSVSFTPPPEWDFAQRYHLADPRYHESKVIDLLIGVDHLYQILQPSMITQLNRPTLISSQLGWLLAGPYSTSSIEPSVRCLHAKLTQPEVDSITEFLGLNEPPRVKDTGSVDELECERIFVETHKRDPVSGRFIVKLPRRSDKILGESRQLAINCLKRTCVSAEYREFLREYEALGHLTRCAPPIPNQITYYIPHHAVYHNGKIQVVFDASMKTTNGVSLNDTLLVGPTLQAPLFIIFLRFRMFLYAFTADIIKMYRQMWVPDEDRDLQRIVIYENGEIIDCQLNTITYGTSSAPHSAIRTIFQLADDGESEFPAAAAVLRKNTYVDDTLSGADSLEAVKKLIDELVALLRTAGMELGKWRFSGELADHAPLCDSSVGRTLGVEWDSAGDFFSFPSLANVTVPENTVTKRIALSKVSSIFDPLGFLAPLAITGKLLIQELWTDNLDWDENVSADFQQRFNRFLNDITASASLQFPRYVGNAESVHLELHGFSDASKEAYAACIYARILKENAPPVVRLIASKTRVAPQRQPRTIPELELCAAALLTELFEPVITTLGCNRDRCYAYTDSTIVLAYLAKEPGHWTQFVANRVKNIVRTFPAEKWRHVAGEINPADLATRQKSFSELESRFDLWLHGPEFLHELKIPPNHLSREFGEEIFQATLVYVHVNTVLDEIPPQYADFARYIINQYSDLSKVLSIITAWLRIKDFFLSQVRKTPSPSGSFSAAEYRRAELELALKAQHETYPKEFDKLIAKRPLPSRSRLTSLSPFLEKGLIRVGGRIECADLPYYQRHPVIIPANHRFTHLLIRDCHRRFAHAGPQFITAYLRRRYWLIGNLNSQIQQVIRTCAKCARFRRNAHHNPPMADLPADRVRPSPPFSIVGVDYAGPFNRKPEIRSRSTTRLKSYVAVFVCFSTRAVHLEVVLDLTTAAFLAALKRFAARRGCPLTIYSDNGTNFTGAANELNEKFNELAQSTEIQKFASPAPIEWRFNPPAAPHMGGLWEAAVRIMKNHLYKTIGDTELTTDEFCTLLCHIESIMNSRPIVPLRDPASSFDALTPGHFLIGRPLVAVSDDTSNSDVSHYRTRWDLVTQLRNAIWRRWKPEVLTSLQKRVKWTASTPQFEINDIVILSKEETAPLQWPLGRIIRTYPDSQGTVRSVDVICRNGTVLKRPVHNLIPLIDVDEVSTPDGTSADGGGM
ncbi:uncharacterized protein LOC135834119 [Planococcus citri]|uniref:uncharacterized protein LOC135834119 n=1 Tax=Planococcus citri TaxID=170843 RepID=UPI0031F91E35